ncbi:membrane lipoprotein lipid attachment site-containing protein [Actinobacillus genomosp. 1]|uniref:membrane lipoprotein lipid attachment site-containing protein n=1 Tax=Actinobacillus genomosp. 1 TaxID=254839 RepID=UPI002441DD5A|nr:membrane lipoprotein lipid attachment site-containing protein [Actinobacillus genomosp. 1]WGE34017.1 membrane lipoprotein lipid attachment site-containing protein [Actinobacillus genomosp. 1]WGE36065.1 membrane lipoprotein lipid attachment site-containing protein [Actinobacillus genomosp. 1]WGE91401.1 membrane lipoprotein lipid attachment site-containing protein [Actinobacillus genomosp. 1]
MKKISFALLATVTLAACTQDFYANKGNATVLSSKNLSQDSVELTVQKDSGEVVTLTRNNDPHATVGARVNLSEKTEQKDSDLTTIRRYEFK